MAGQLHPLANHIFIGNRQMNNMLTREIKVKKKKTVSPEIVCNYIGSVKKGKAL